MPAAGVPLSTPVPALKRDAGSAARRSRLSVGVGKPVAVTVNVPATPTVKVVAFALVIAGAWFDRQREVLRASAPTPLVAVNVIG